MIDIGHLITWAFLVILIFVDRIKIAKPGLDKPPKPPKTYICPHGNVATLKPYTSPNGQKRVLCDYCYNKEGGVTYDLPRL